MFAVTYETYPWGVVGKALVDGEIKDVYFEEYDFPAKVVEIIGWEDKGNHLFVNDWDEIELPIQDEHHLRLCAFTSLFDYGWVGYIRRIKDVDAGFGVMVLIEPVLNALQFSIQNSDCFKCDVLALFNILLEVDDVAMALLNFLSSCEDIFRNGGSQDDCQKCDEYVLLTRALESK